MKLLTPNRESIDIARHGTLLYLTPDFVAYHPDMKIIEEEWDQYMRTLGIHVSKVPELPTEYNCYTKATQETVEILTAQTAQTMCFCCSLSTAREIMETGVIPTSLFTNGQLNCWFTPRGALLRTLQMHWSGISIELDEKVTVLCCNPSLRRF